jgi:hypothetical protein
MSPTEVRRCIYPGCERPAVPPHPLGGPQPSFCDLEEHNALTAHQARQRLDAEQAGAGDADGRNTADSTTVTDLGRRFSDGR